MPWEDLLALVEPLGTGTPRRGRQPWPAETLPQTHLARCRPDLTGVACEDACYDSLSVRDFVGCRYRVPDATTPGDFRHLPGENDVGRALLDVVVARLEATGLVMRGGSEGGATIMEAPSLPEDASGSRDPETRLARKGNQGHLGTRCPSGEDAGSGHARGATLAVAGVPDVREAHALVRPDDGLCHADAAWRGARQARGGPLGPAPLQGVFCQVKLSKNRIRIRAEFAPDLGVCRPNPVPPVLVTRPRREGRQADGPGGSPSGRGTAPHQTNPSASGPSRRTSPIHRSTVPSRGSPSHLAEGMASSDT